MQNMVMGIHNKFKNFDVTLKFLGVTRTDVVWDKVDGSRDWPWPGGLAPDSCDQHQPIRGLWCDMWPIRGRSVITPDNNRVLILRAAASCLMSDDTR